MEIRLKDYYHWVVLGDHPGALLSASIMAGAGFSVLVLPLSPSSLSYISPSYQLLDHESNFLLGLGNLETQNGLFSEVLKKLGFQDFENRSVFDGDDRLPEVITPRYRFGMRKNNESFFEDIQREFGVDSDEASGLLPALSASGDVGLPFWNRLPLALLEGSNQLNQRSFSMSGQSIEKLKVEISKRASSVPRAARSWFQLSKIFSSENLSELLEGIYFAMTDSLNQNPKAIDLIQLMALSRTGASFKGGVSGLRKILVDLAIKQGATVPRDINCRRVFVEAGKLIGVQVTDRGKMISVEGGILGCSINHAKEYLYFSGDQKKHPLKTPPVPKGWKFTIALTVYKEAIPPGMRSRVIWKEKGAPIVEIEVGHPKDYEFGDAQHRFIFLRTVLPYTQATLDSNNQRKVAMRMFRQLKEIVPFLDFHVVRIYPDFRGSSSLPSGEADPFKEAYGFLSPEFIPENLRVYGAKGLGFRSGVEGIFIGSREAYPELGSFGPIVAAIEATSQFVLDQPKSENGVSQLREFWNSALPGQL